MKFLLGTKEYMSQLFTDDGTMKPVTVVKAGPCVVTQLKNSERDGYSVVQVGFGVRTTRTATKAERGHQQTALAAAERDPQTESFRWLREAPLDTESYSVGDVIDPSIFEPGEKVTISGTTKGKGFQGGMKRHGFHGAKERTHGTKHSTREIGSIGATGPQRVFKGKKMPGRMGNNRVTFRNHEIVAVDADNNYLYIKGAVPGKRGDLVEITGA